MTSPPVRFYRSIAAQLLKVVFGLYLVVAIIVTVFQLTAEYFQVKETITQELESLPITFGPSIADALWRFSESSIQSILIGMHQNPIISGVQVIDEKVGEFFSIGTIVNNDGKIVSVEQIEDSSAQKSNGQLFSTLYSFEFPVTYIGTSGGQRQIGTVVVFSSTSVIFERVKYGFILILINTVIITLALLVIFLFFLRKVLGRPLEELTVAVEKVDLDNLENMHVQFKTPGNNELHLLLQVFNNMIERLFRTIEERKKSEEERKKLESQLRQSQKMEAIGTLAGGIAHDFNNILGAILGYTEMALEDLPTDSKVANDLQKVMKAGVRAKDLVKQILSFSRKGDQELKPLKIQTIIKEALKLLRSSIPTTIEIKQNIDPDCKAVLADPTQVHQIIMNLCTNSYHVMRETGGILAITLKPIELTSEALAYKINLQPGSYLKLEISDTGYGIPEDNLERIFEPYFTTKPKGEGTGLGLAVVHGIVRSIHGDITVYSELGKGTTFNIYLPVIEEKTQILKEEGAAPLPTGNERILLVDDDEDLANISKRMLQSLGYEVTVLTNSLDALKEFQKNPEDYDLIITDMTMPDITGEELAKRSLTIRPGIPLILCTGFSDLINEDDAKAIGFRDFIMKPVMKNDLAKSIRKVLNN